MLGDKQVADLTASFGAALGGGASCRAELGGFTLRTDDGGGVSFAALPRAHSGKGPAVLVTAINVGATEPVALLQAFTRSIRGGVLPSAEIVVAGAGVVQAFEDPLAAAGFKLSDNGLTMTLN